MRNAIICAISLAALVSTAAVAQVETQPKALDIAIITDSRGSPGPVLRKEDIKLNDQILLRYDELWPVIVSKMEGVKLSFPTQGRRLQNISEVSPYLIAAGKVWDVLVLQCGYDEYYRPQENKKMLQARAVAGDIDQRFVEDLKTRDYDIRGSELEKYTFETIRKYAKKIVYVTINLGDFEMDRQENERFKKLGAFDYIIELPLDPQWAPTKTFDGAHYNAAGHAYVAEQVVAVLKKIMAQPAAPRQPQPSAPPAAAGTK